jgi:NAD(P) transhydrogenase subunit beta
MCREASWSLKECCACLSGSLTHGAHEGGIRKTGLKKKMTNSFAIASYTLASLLFILSLRNLSTQESAQRGNLLGVCGMILAIVVTGISLYTSHTDVQMTPSGASFGLLGGSILVGSIIGAILASRVAMTSMPELVAVLHSFVGLAAVLVGIASMMEVREDSNVHDVGHEIEVFIGVFVGAVTLTGSIIAFLKLRGSLSGRPLLLPARHALNAIALIASATLTVLGITTPGSMGITYLLIVTGIASLLGIHLVMAIGGGDMPVVVSLLNSYSGWAASAAGFMLNNDLLIITGALVGSSGAILSFIMCKAMNRSIWNVVFGGFGAEPPAGSGKAKAADPNQKVQSTNTEEVANLLLAAKSVMIIPGYGLAVAQAQHVVKEITSALAAQGIKVQYAIHPVAGRLPGHMNVLLAEAGVSYEIVKEMEEIEHEIPETDVVVVIGANDIVNPSALDDPESPIYGMPVLEVWKAAKVIMLKRGMAAGYAGVDNPLCYRENTLMLFGDAKQSVTKLLTSLQNAKG